ncbi:unnamed protein product [Linum trigynum]|uniref:Cytochrome P450 n=1 Tax=Linum trigynum TaxID=586398 RepID=A0AAV2EQF6_9ROSI
MRKDIENQYYFWPFLLTFLAIVLATWVRRRNKRSPPGPWKLPIIGNLHQLAGTNTHLPLHQRLWEMSKKYGAVMELQLGEIRNVFISSAEAAEQVMKKHEVVFSSRSATLSTDILFYGGQDMFFSPYGDYWRQLRKLCTMELLTIKRVVSFRSIRAEEVSNVVATISRSVASGEAVDLKQLLLVLTNTMTSRAALGKAPKVMTERFMEVAEEMVGSLGGFRLSDLFPSWKFLAVVSGFRSKLMADLVLDEIINQHITNTFSEDETKDLVDVLLKLKKSNDLGVSLTMEALKGVLLNMFLGGTDTTAIAIEWTMSEIMKNPGVMQRVQKEARGVFQENVNEEKLHELEYLKAVIKETFRLHPPAPILIPKETPEKVEINGFKIPIKSRVMVNVWVIGRDPTYWVEPEKFDPERFLNSTIDYKGANFEYIPFGAGRRMCPGMNFGMVVVQFVLANMLFHFDWKLTDGMKLKDFDMTEVYDTTLRKKEKLFLVPMAPRRP